jgi:hypothetical protein
MMRAEVIGYLPPYMKIKFDLDYNTKVPKLVLFDKNLDDNTKNLVEFRHIDDVQNYIRYSHK